MRFALATVAALSFVTAAAAQTSGSTGTSSPTSVGTSGSGGPALSEAKAKPKVTKAKHKAHSKKH